MAKPGTIATLSWGFHGQQAQFRGYENVFNKKNSDFAFTFNLYAIAAGKLILEGPAGSNIESIEIEKDNLLLKSKGKTYTFKFSELIKDKIAPTAKISPKNLDEALKYNGEWYFFKQKRKSLNVLKYAEKSGFKTLKNGDLLKRVQYKGKYYARDLENNIYLPHREIKSDFSPHLVPAKAYIKYIDDAVKQLEQRIKEAEYKVTDTENTVRYYREQYITFLTKNNLTTSMIDQNGNVVTSGSSGRFTGKLKSELRRYCKDLKEREKVMKASVNNLDVLKSSLRSGQRLQKKIHDLYIQYVISKP